MHQLSDIARQVLSGIPKNGDSDKRSLCLIVFSTGESLRATIKLPALGTISTSLSLAVAAK